MISYNTIKNITIFKQYVIVICLLLILTTLNSNNVLANNKPNSAINPVCDNCNNNWLNKYRNIFSKSKLPSNVSVIANKVKSFIKKRLNISQTFDYINNNLKTTHGIRDKIFMNLEPIKAKLRKTMFEFIYTTNISNECLQGLYKWTEGLKSGELWAYKCKLII